MYSSSCLDGSSVAFVSGRDGNLDVYVIHLKTEFLMENSPYFERGTNDAYLTPASSICRVIANSCSLRGE